MATDLELSWKKCDKMRSISNHLNRVNAMFALERLQPFGCNDRRDADILEAELTMVVWKEKLRLLGTGQK